jgi:hypothetical protein
MGSFAGVNFKSHRTHFKHVKKWLIVPQRGASPAFEPIVKNRSRRTIFWRAKTKTAMVQKHRGGF